MSNRNQDNFLPLVDIKHIYNPRFHLVDLISTRRRPFASSTRTNIPRPPNSFFLMKNCLLLELKHSGHRITMPNLCKMAREIWKEIPQDAKNMYDALAIQAQILHQRVYPNYRFEPKKKTRFKQFVPPSNNGMSAFSSVPSAPITTSSPSLSSTSSSSSSPTPTTPQLSEEVYLPVLPSNANDFSGSYNLHNDNYGIIINDNLYYNNINYNDINYNGNINYHDYYLYH
uniref:MATA-HMG n=1 Tax=Rhizophagus irregularis TaxID=588596 RepID=A0A1B1EVX2_9GLOM|nr:MATA-HMG [Rhizophagus irregularis]